MNAQCKAVRWTTAVLGVACLTMLAGCGQPQVIRETVVVVATQAPATIQPPISTQPAAEPSATATPSATDTPSPRTATPELAATTALQSEAATPAQAIAPTEAPVPTQAPAQPTAVPPTTAPTAEPTAAPTTLPVAWGDLPVLLGSPFLPAGGNLVVINLSPVAFSGPTQPVAVQFRIVDPAGETVFESQDDDAPFCPLGDSPTGCAVLTMGNAQWREGKPVLAGLHTLQMTAIDAQQRASRNQTQFDLNYAWADLPALGTMGIAPQGPGGLLVTLRVSPVVFAGARPVRVFFTMLDPNGNVVFERVDGDSPWCAFGDADTVSNCKTMLFDKPAWPSGKPVTLGTHTLNIRAEDGQGGTQTKQVTFNFEMMPVEAPTQTPARPTLPKLTVVVPPQKAAPLEDSIQYRRLRIKGDLDMQLIYPDKARGSLMIYLTAKRPGAAANGDGVGRIEFEILDVRGSVVNREEESTPAFCAFGGNDPCTAIALKQGAVWPSTGISISSGPHTVQVTVWGKDAKGNLTGPWRGRAKFDVIVPGQN